MCVCVCGVCLCYRKFGYANRDNQLRCSHRFIMTLKFVGDNALANVAYMYTMKDIDDCARLVQ